MSAEASLYFHAVCEGCGLDVGTKITADADKVSADARTHFNGVCPSCGTAYSAVRITAWEYERSTALVDECAHCGQQICFLGDRLTWVHEVDTDERTDPDYGIESCETAMVDLFGLPAPQYAGLVAEPSDTATIVDLATGAEQKASESAKEFVKQMTVSVNASTEAMSNAAKQAALLIENLKRTTK